MNNEMRIALRSDLNGYVLVEKTLPSGSSVTTADDQTGAVDEDHALYWSLRQHDASVEAW